MNELLELPQLPLTERDRRWKAIRDAMKVQKLDCLIVWGANSSWDSKIANVRYLSQIGGNGEQACVIFPLSGEPSCFTSFAWINDWWRYSQIWVKDVQPIRKSWASSIAGRLNELELEKGNIGVIGLPGLFDREGWIPYVTYQQIVEEMPKANLINATALVEAVRMIKSPVEITCMEKAGELGDLMWDTMVKTAKPGVKERVVYAKMMETMLSNGGEYPTLFLWESGPAPLPHPFFLVTDRTLQNNDLISVEVHPKYNGYLSHQERSICLGKPQKEVRHIYNVAQQCFSHALSILVPGMELEEYVTAIRQPIYDAGMNFVEAGIHGHGLESPEFPTIQSPLQKKLFEGGKPAMVNFDTKLKAGMVFALIFDLIDPNYKDGKTGAALADTILVTQTGGRRLNKYNLDILDR
jgi:Xaa-Pro aminopeptidase